MIHTVLSGDQYDSLLKEAIKYHEEQINLCGEHEAELRSSVKADRWERVAEIKKRAAMHEKEVRSLSRMARYSDGNYRTMSKSDVDSLFDCFGYEKE